MVNLESDIVYKKSKRLGRGTGSGKGKTCGRGQKGQKARSGVAVNAFEGGQNPFYTRVPKRGFVNVARLRSKKQAAAVSLASVGRLVRSGKIPAGECVNLALMRSVGLVSAVVNKVKLVFADDKDALPLKYEVSAASNTVMSAVKSAGGHVSLVS